MPRFFIGYWTNDLTDTKKDFLPIGVVVRTGDNAEVRVVDYSDIPDDYKPKSQLSKLILRDLDSIFRRTREPSNNPTNLYFTEIKCDTDDETKGLADRLFSERVLCFYRK